MSEVTIQPDVTEEVTEEEAVTNESPLSQRDEVIQRIAEKKQQQLEEDGSSEEVEMSGDIESQPPETTEEENDATPEMVRVKVDGVEKDVPRDTIIEHGIRTFQKESVADMRLRDAAERKQMLDRREAELVAKLSNYEKGVENVNVIDRKAEFAEALISDEEVAAEMFAESVRRVASLEKMVKDISVDVAASREFVQGSVRSEKQRLLSLFKREFPQIAGDAHLSAKANQRTIELMSENPGMSHDEVVIQAGKDVNDYIMRIAGVDDSAGSLDTGAKTVKRNMPRPARKAAGRTPAPPEVKRKTTADVIREMQEKRSPFR